MVNKSKAFLGQILIDPKQTIAKQIWKIDWRADEEPLCDRNPYCRLESDDGEKVDQTRNMWWLISVLWILCGLIRRPKKQSNCESDKSILEKDEEPGCDSCVVDSPSQETTKLRIWTIDLGEEWRNGMSI